MSIHLNSTKFKKKKKLCPDSTHNHIINCDNPILLRVAWDSTLGCFFGSLAFSHLELLD